MSSKRRKTSLGLASDYSWPTYLLWWFPTTLIFYSDFLYLLKTAQQFLTHKSISLTACNESLGLRRGKIKDTQITGKGNAAGTYPYQAKYDSTGWCVNRVDSRSSSFSVDYYLQVDFLEVKKISGILLRGIKKPKGFTYGPRVKLEYKIRPDESYKEKVIYLITFLLYLIAIPKK